MIASDFHITIAQLQTWNPWIGSDCDTGVYANLTDDNQRAICVAVNGSSPTMTATIGPSTLVSTTSIGPTQTGIAADCKQYYTVQDGDSCASIDAKFAITFAQFYAWNPASKYSTYPHNPLAWR